MLTNILLPFFSMLLNLEVVSNATQEIDKLNKLIAVLSICLIIILALLTINLIKIYKLNTKNKHINI